MAEYLTVEQAQAQADLLAKEFSNRQILIYGVGEPSMNFPLGVEYEDRSVMPAVRYRKVGSSPADWMKLLTIEAASETEVLEGVNDQKMVTPARLTEKLNQFSSEVIGLPRVEADNISSTIMLLLEWRSDGQTFKVSLPDHITLNMASIVLQPIQALSELTAIEGGETGQLINLKRASTDAIEIKSSDFIKVSQPFLMNDAALFDNISLQKINASTWVEVSRKKF
jgi:hypothetical protein